MKLIDNPSKTGIVKRIRKGSQIVVTAPHHSIGGVEELPCPSHKASDENTGYTARELANKLNCSYYIVCNAKVDFNKSAGNKYQNFIEQSKPSLLVEIHGHGGRKIEMNNIEISCGREDNNAFSMLFSKILNRKLKMNSQFKGFDSNGDINEIYYKASKAVSIQNPNWNSLHIELPTTLRVDESNKNQMPVNNSVFIGILADSIIELINSQMNTSVTQSVISQ